MMRDFVTSTRIRDIHFTPHILALNTHIHTVSFMFVELYTKLVYRLKFERELFRLSDGGTIAIDWVLDHEGGFPRKNS
jgi:predicted alpha/beta-fold hydrolase